MSSPLRVVLLLAALVALGAGIALSSRSTPKRAAAAREPAPSLARDARAAPAPSETSASVAAPRQPPSPSPLPSPAASAASAAESPNADSMAAMMHALEDSAPERALLLAQRGQALWPTGPRAPEFAATEVKCLYRLGRPSEGRGAAEAMVNKYPTSTWALEVERQTGAHPYVNH